MDYRRYDPEKDRVAAHRIYREVGWMREGDGSAEATDRFHEAGPTRVALVNGEPEFLVSNHPGTIRHLDEEIPPRDGLPAMRTSVNTLTRLWFGVRPPSGPALTSPDLDGDPGLIRALDGVLRLPAPLPDWDY